MIYRSTCTDACVIVCTDFSTESMGMYGNTCTYISTEFMGAHGVTSTDDSTINTVVRGISKAYAEYRRYKPKWGIGADVVVEIRKEIRHADALQ